MDKMNVRSDQHQDAHLSRGNQYQLEHHSTQHWKTDSSHFTHEPGHEYDTRVMSREREHLSEASDRAEVLQEFRGQVESDEAQGYGRQMEQSKGQQSYSESQEIPRRDQVLLQNDSVQTNQAIRAFGVTAFTPFENHHQKALENYFQQLQTYESARNEALREHQRLTRQQLHRDEYERAIIYDQNLQHNQQAMRSIQNFELAERRDDQMEFLREQQQTQNSNSGQNEATTSELENLQTADEIRRAKLKRRKLMNFEKLKQMERNRKQQWLQQQQQQSQERNQIESKRNYHGDQVDLGNGNEQSNQTAFHSDQINQIELGQGKQK